MSMIDLTLLSPMLITGGAALVLMLVVAWNHAHVRVAGLTGLSFLLALATIPLVTALPPRPVTSLLTIDGYGLFFMTLLIGASLVVCLLGYAYWKDSSLRYGEFYILVLLATLGAEVLVTSNHAAAFVLGLELLSVSLYGLIAYTRLSPRPLEAGIKYLILSAAASTFVVFGIALLYFDLGELEFSVMQSALSEQGPISNMVRTGLVMILIGITFQLGLVPFHMCTPDVYEGAPAPVSACFFDCLCRWRCSTMRPL